MADLYQSEYDEIRLRKSVQDGEDLIALLNRDGSITIVDDPSAKDVEAAQKKLEGLHAKQAELADDADPEEREKLTNEIADVEHTASFPVAAPAETEEEAKTKKADGETKES